MSTPSGNPFAFPGMGLGQTPENVAGNPIWQSMEMMRQAWTSLGGQMMPGASAAAPVLNVEELDRRIGELRSVENWLRLNLTMLEGTIQAMQVQRATIATLHSFANMATPGVATPGTATAGQGASPLDAVLGTKAAPATPQPAPRPETKASEAAEPAATDGNAGQSAGPSPHQAWWNLLQNQFNQLASAAAAFTPEPPAAAAAAPKPAKPASAPASKARKTARKTPASKS